jgi:cytochrome b561
MSGADTRRDAARYDPVARALHWTMAVLIVAALILGLFGDAMEQWGWNPISLHKSLGITTFVTAVGRLAWRIAHPAPPYPAHLAAWEKAAAKAAVWFFYAAMLAMPIGGYIFSSAGRYPMQWFGVPLPKLPVERGSALADIAREGHELLGFVVAGVVVLHIAAALRHRLRRDGVWPRMAPATGKR